MAEPAATITAPPSAVTTPDHRAGAPSIWAFVAADSASFGLFFTIFSIERYQHRGLFARSARELDIFLGLFNTVDLITSSWLVALSLVAARKGDIAGARRRLRLAFAVASLFALCKVFEYSSKIAHGITPLTNEFFSFYFVFTAVHLFHYLIGMGALIYAIGWVTTKRDFGKRELLWVNSVALYWHLVDLLWIFLFPLLYLQRGA